ncbi:hypothetical protein, partial [Arachnia propionica]|uniref:hypothetical protein n=1 Tax=Arachnia propionica TaxID=1750 RepID=UPI001C8AD13B
MGDLEAGVDPARQVGNTPELHRETFTTGRPLQHLNNLCPLLGSQLRGIEVPGMTGVNRRQPGGMPVTHPGKDRRDLTFCHLRHRLD